MLRLHAFTVPLVAVAFCFLCKICDARPQSDFEPDLVAYAVKPKHRGAATAPVSDDSSSVPPPAYAVRPRRKDPAVAAAAVPESPTTEVLPPHPAYAVRGRPTTTSTTLPPPSTTTESGVRPKPPCGYWKDGIIPYFFDGKFSPSEIERAEEYFAQLMADSCGITLRRKQGGDADYVLFTRANIPGLCYAQGTGKCGGAQRVFFDTTCIMEPSDKSRFLHEMLHVFGLAHEFQRPDRDEYVVVTSKDANFVKYDSWLPGWDSASPYDFESVLHYQNNDNVRVRPGRNYDSNLLGTRTELSAGDKEKLSRLYPCDPFKGQ